MSINTPSSGKHYWKSLQEFAQTPEFLKEYSDNATKEFSEDYDKPVEHSNGMNRRTFVGLLSASMALAATSCRRPDHKIVPAVKMPEYMIPGMPNHFTTVFTHGNAALGLLVKSREGRPVKIEGNDLHPTSTGASSVLAQASLLSLYDPDRIQISRLNKGTSPKANIISHIAKAIQNAQTSGKTARILMDEHASPSLAALIKEIETAFPHVKFITLPGILTDSAAIANKAVFGIDGEFVIDFSKADAILAVDSDFLGTSNKNTVFNTRSFSKKRKPTLEEPEMSMLIVAESVLSITGSSADMRIKVAPNLFDDFLAGVLKEVIEKKNISAFHSLAEGLGTPSADAKKAAEELLKAKEAVVSVGSHLSPRANALGACLNIALGAFGADKAINPAHQLPMSNVKGDALSAFYTELQKETVGVVLFLDTNPEYAGEKDLRAALANVPNRFAISVYENDTAVKCSAYIPMAHYLESWGDALAFDGTLTIQQPLIAPLNESSLTIGDALIALAKEMNAGLFGETDSYYKYLRARWEKEYTANADKAAFATFEAFWDKTLRDGVYKTKVQAVTLNAPNISAIAGLAKTTLVDNAMTVAVVPSYALYDGKLANNGWLQELPDPITKVVWENTACLSKKTAEKMGIKEGDVLSVKTGYGAIELPAFIVPGMVDNIVATATGYGQTMGGVILKGAGQNAFTLVGSGTIGYIGATVQKTGKTVKLAASQRYFDYMKREIIKETTLEKIKKKDKELFEPVEVPGRKKGEDRFTLPLSVMQNFEYKGHRWGMTIDMTACTGCNACVIACQSENNIPIVGKKEVANGRELHWIRLDRYYAGDPENPDVVTQPMLCQQCENAPCENVCPVAATTHSPEGLNEMTYNRCVGTRYCSNNCPYKVRRFNYLNFYKWETRSPIEFVNNPDVTVRMRGVMEKCTFCVQRINEAKFHAKDQGRSRVKDGEVMSACEQACPAGAITFGDTNDAQSRVAKKRKDERGFLVLEELNVRPQITYLAKVRNREEKLG